MSSPTTVFEENRKAPKIKNNIIFFISNGYETKLHFFIEKITVRRYIFDRILQITDFYIKSSNKLMLINVCYLTD